MRKALLLVFLLAVPASAQEWTPVATALLEKEKPGNFGLCGVVVDHANGDVIVELSDKGFYRSADQGKTWQRLNEKIIKGRTETPGCLMLDPTGKSKKLVSALVYGSPIVVSPDRTNFTAMNNKSSHVDWCAVDWSDPEMKFVLALKHEAADALLVSHDAGQSFAEVGKGYGPAYIFDANTAVVAEAKMKDRPMPGLLRTTDAGKTFTKVSDYSAKALPRFHNGTLYWLAAGELIASEDQGKTWTKLGAVKDGRFGPVFGKDAKHMFALTGAGIAESVDRGATWKAPIAMPKEMKGVSNLTWLDYDPINDVVYTMKMASDLYRLDRKR